MIDILFSIENDMVHKNRQSFAFVGEVDMNGPLVFSRVHI